MLSLLPLASVALDNGVARTPPMGWMTWERFRCTADGGDVAGGGTSQPSCAEDPENCISERLVRQHAEIMARPEWRGAGYEYLNIDDCWENWRRSPGGKLTPNSTRFPHGMRALADYVHSLGLKLGTYNDMGTETCGGYPGECKDESCSLPGYMGVDAATYAGWGIDSLKMDGCHSVHTHGVLDPAYRCMGEALNRTGRPVLYSCSWPDYIRTAKGEAPVNYTETAMRCNMWRMYNDIQDSYESVSGIIDWVGDHAEANGMLAAQGPGAWNDPDMLLVGNFGLSLTQAKAQMALWSIMAAPLMMGNDLRRLSEEMKAVLLAREVIAVDQDPLGKQGRRVFQLKGSQCGAHDVWARPLANGDTAVVLWNRGVCGTHSLLGFDWPTVGVADASRRMAVRDLFEQRDLGVHAGSFSSFVDLSGVLMLRLSPAEGAEHRGAS
mmetsp:Transcript_29962/g.95861  ORF Transcript_29962/g.95861 Transcript_29962/m.95861 type:complete len:438 (+) Transcript_29962:56-1369(+)|eukprot:CAMPEP_0185368284 /NCGR_PEP_ID=MMETSP1364-20130426/14910_1 /TAXON_ID=38817 /ORGANISM="Gephyrocapsa oceanica, Strain RCC1303" /LENGTH=437 /DNA_ID=CAMNT_0027968957 /DNA_START=36 /DNA_END=1349 /DNA_ORIENTATION=-